MSGFPRGWQDQAAKFGMANARARGAFPVAVIDGPYDAATLSNVLAQPPVDLGEASCAVSPGNACGHGTFIIGLLGARRDAAIPGLCPDCRLLHVPLFADGNAPSASTSELAKAVNVAIAAGARLINISLAIPSDHPQDDPELAAALDNAQANGAVVLVAAGNQGRVAEGQLISHPVTIPVVAIDAAHRSLPESNFGPTLSHRGVAALGHQVFGYAPGGATTTMSGTSVATAVATGTLAQLWSMHPHADGAALRAAVARLESRSGPIPPMLHRNVLLAALGEGLAPAPETFSERRMSNDASFQGGTMTMDKVGRSMPPGHGGNTTVGRAVVPAHAAGGCACGAPGGVCSCANGGASRFIYVLGTVDIRFPDQSISEELQSVALSLSRQPGGDKSLSEPKPDETLRAWYARVLSHPDARYVARLVSWLLTVEGQPAYYLALRDLQDLPDLISCLARDEPADPHEHEDLDLFVGSSTLMAIDTCPGITAPVLAVEQVSSLNKQVLTKAFELSPKSSTKPASKDKARSISEKDRNVLFRRLVRSADNFGDTDEWRALNYLAVRYQPLYELYAELVKPNPELAKPKTDRDGWTLDSIRVVRSRLAREKRIVDPVFAFRNNETGIVHQYFVRLDVSHLYPMVINPIAEYFDR